MNLVVSRLETRLWSVYFGGVRSDAGNVRNQDPQALLPCGYRCIVIIYFALVSIPTCSSFPSLIQLYQRTPKGFHVCSQISQPITITPRASATLFLSFPGPPIPVKAGRKMSHHHLTHYMGRGGGKQE